MTAAQTTDDSAQAREGKQRQNQGHGIGGCIKLDNKILIELDSG